MNEIIEDTLSRNRKFKKRRKDSVERLKKLNAPKEVIEHEQMLSEMTLLEYHAYCKDQEKEYTIQKTEYAKSNPIQKHIVDEIYERESKLEYDFFACISFPHFLHKISALDFITESDFGYEIYDAFLNHAREIYLARYFKHHEQECLQRGIV